MLSYAVDSEGMLNVGTMQINTKAINNKNFNFSK